MVTSAIDALRGYYNSLSAVEKVKFGQETGFKDANALRLIRPELAEQYCKNHGIKYKNSIHESIWNRSKDADANKEAATRAYDFARNAESAADKAKNLAESNWKKMLAQYDDKDSRYQNAYSKYKNSVKAASSAQLAREIAGERMVSASKTSLRAFQNGMIADAMLGRA